MTTSPADGPTASRVSKPTATALMIGCAFAVSMALCDVLFGMLNAAPEGLASLTALLPPLGLATVTCFGLYAGCWPIVAKSGRGQECEPTRLALSLAAFWASVLIIAAISDLTNLAEGTRSAWAVAKLVMSLTLGLFVGVACYRLIPPAVTPERLRAVIKVAALMVTSILTLSVVYVWVRTYHAGAGLVGLIAFVLFSAAALFVVRTVMESGHRFKPAGFAYAAVVLMVLGPVFFWLDPDRAGASTGAVPTTDHAVSRVILLSIDTLRADMLSCYNPDGVSTPNLDRIAGDSVVFERAIAPASWTLPSFCSIMSGVGPSVHQASVSSPQLPAVLPTLAEHLQAAGYVTGAIGLNRWLLPESNLSKGFDDYRIYPPGSLGSTLSGRLLRQLAPDRYQRIPSSPDLTRLASEWVADHADEDFFFWLHYLDPHSPYEPPADHAPDGDAPKRIGHSFTETNDMRGGNFVASAEERKWIRLLYEAEVRHVDDCVGRFLARLDKLGLYDDALIVVLSDHGEEFWEHNGADHGHTMYDELLHVPLMIKLPKDRSAAQRVAEPVSVGGVMPTLLDLCELTYESRYMSYASLTPLLPGGDGRYEPGPIFAGGNIFYDDYHAVITQGMKYIRSTISGREELYDLNTDPEEQTSLAATAPEKLDAARTVADELEKDAARLRAHFEAQGMTSGSGEMSDEKLRDLRSLGYVR